jgi:hypothetical protein
MDLRALRSRCETLLSTLESSPFDLNEFCESSTPNSAIRLRALVAAWAANQSL